MAENTQRGGLHAYTLVIPANRTTKRTVRGTTIRVADAPFEVEITAHAKKLGGMKGTNFTLPMKKFEKWFTDIEYDEIEVANDSDSEILVVLQLGYGDFEAEILSRTVAAAGIRSTNVASSAVPIAALSPGAFIEFQLFDDDAQRKRALLDIEAVAQGGVVLCGIGRSGLTDINDIEDLALSIALDRTGHMEVTCDVSAYVYCPQSEGGDATDITVEINVVEELYNAS